jgi:hypothetical protein
MSAYGGEADITQIWRHVRLLPMLLKKAKMNQSKFLPARPSKSVFRNPMYRRALTKAAGWKWD